MSAGRWAGAPGLRSLRGLFAGDPSTAVWAGVLVVLVLASALFGFPAPLGIVVLGAVIGSLIAFISLGIILVYRTNRIINFAQADIGAVAAVLSVMIVAQWRVNYFVGVAAGVAVALGLGALIEVIVVRRFFKAPRLILTVATVALTQLLVFLELVLPRAFRVDFVSVEFPTPFAVRFPIPDPRGLTPPVIFDGNHLLAILAVPAAIAGLGAFLRFTRSGVAARGAADNAERAALLGIPVKRISTIVWTIAAGLSAFGALLRAPTIGLAITGGAFGPGLMVRGLAPAVIARMENLRTAFLASVVLGIVDQAAYFRKPDPAISDTILFLVILGALLLRPRAAASRADHLEASSWQAVREVRPIPRELRGLPEVRHGLRAALVLPLVSVMLVGLFAPGLTDVLSLMLIFGIVGASLVMLTGWAGQVSLGQVAFVAVGAAICGNLVAERGYNLLVALPIAGLAGALAAVVIGLPALRIRGLFLAASTLAFGLFVSSMVLNRTYFGWLVPEGRIERPAVFGVALASHQAFFFFTLAVLVVVLASMRSVRRSRTGRVLIGSRDNERAARAFGVSVTRARLAAFALSGFYAALAGGLYALHQNGVIAASFGVEKSLQAFVMVTIGGLGSIPGALFGAAYFFGTQHFLSGAASLFASGIGMLVLLMLVPGGLGQIVYGIRDGLLRWIAGRRRIVVPSLVADVRVEDSVLLPGARRVEALEVQGGSD